jgi:hypothetical protein
MSDLGLKVHVRSGSDTGPNIEGADLSGSLVATTTGADGLGTIDGFAISVQAPGHAPYLDQVYRHPNLDTPGGMPISLQPWPSGGRLPRLHAEDWAFKDEAGHRWVWCGFSLFRAYQRFLAGEDLGDVLRQARDLGANVVRVLGMFHWSDGNGPLHPQDHPHYYDALPAFLDLCAHFDLYVEFCVFADTGHIMNEPDQQTHFQKVCDALRPCTNAFLELVNENDAHENHVNIASFPKPDGITSCSGSNGGGSNPPGPYWDYSALHAERRDDRTALTTTTVWFAIHGYSEGADSFAGTQRTTINDEPYGFAEENEPGRRTNDPSIAYLMGVGCAYGGGGTAHCTDGIQAVVLRPIQAECARRFLAGVKAGGMR